nr:hypothetical protein [Amycolatopsis sp. CA-128772]
MLLVSLVLGPSLLTLIGGVRYAGATMPVWPFALAGSMLALVQILLYARLADGDRRVTVLMWSAVAVEAVLITTWLHGSATQVVTAAAVTAGALAAAGAVLELRPRKPA